MRAAPTLPEVELEPEPEMPALGAMREETFSGLIDAAIEAEEALAAPEAAAAPAADTHEIELDLGEVFTLDMEEEESPSQVKPPPDMLGQAHKRPAWALAADEPPTAEPAAEATLELDDGLPSLEESPFVIAGSGEVVVPTMLTDEPSGIDRDLLERTVAEVHEVTPDERADRDVELVSEAEVLAKYGLEEKAIDRLQEALEIRPTNVAAHALLIQMSLDQGKRARVVELANRLAAVAAETGDAEVWPELRGRLVTAGFWVEGDQVALEAPPPTEPEFVLAPEAFAEPEMLAEPEALAEPEVPVEPQPSFALEPMLGMEPLIELEPWADEEPLTPPSARELLEEPPAPEPPPQHVEESAAVRRAKSVELDRMVEGLLAGPRAKRKPAPKPQAPPPPVAPPPVAPPEPELEEAALALGADPAPAPEAVSEAPPPPAEAPPRPAAVFNPREIGEMVEREEWEDEEWQRTPASPLAGVAPGDLPEGFVVAGEQPARAAGADRLDDSGMDWLDEADQGRTEKTTEGLFAGEDDFFDLAAQLEEELSQEPPFTADGGPLVQAQEQSLEEIVEGFKKGVAEHLSPTDYDTHFNLGIAYREMGLLDEAIGEFQLAAKDSRYLLTSCSMLGLCFSEKGLPELAVKWYRRGLEAPGLSEEDNLGLLYDLGCAYLQMGDNETAYKTFVDVYGINTNYRDIVARIEELGHR